MITGASFLFRFENTTNKGIVQPTEDGSFSFKINYPNSYYKHLGSILIEPHIYIKLCGNDKKNWHRSE